jgi:predicted O-methyltransferase YrrM
MKGPMSAKNILRSTKRSLVGYPFFPVINAPIRAFDTWRRYVGPVVKNWIIWVFSSRSEGDFPYALTDRCKINLIASVASILKRDYSEIAGYFREIETDEAFHRHIRCLWAKHPERYRSDASPLIGRRTVWYAIARVTKPNVVVETGVYHGIGAVVLCAALMRNASEGYPGRYCGTDINPRAGYFLQAPYSDHGTIMYGDSLKSLATFSEQIDLFINDSDHAEDYERAEYELIKSKISTNAIVLGDNSHVTSKLAEFSMREGRKFIFLSEEPANHWYRGGGIGISLPK